MINASRKWLKVFLALEVKKLDSSIALIFGIRIKFLDFLVLNKFTTVLLAIPLLPLTILLLLPFSVFESKFGDLVLFNREVNNTAILLKPGMKY